MKKFGYRVLWGLITPYMGIFGLPVMVEEITEIHFVSEAWENVYSRGWHRFVLGIISQSI